MLEPIVKIGVTVGAFFFIMHHILPLVREFASTYIDTKAVGALNTLLVIVLILLSAKKVLALLAGMNIQALGFIGFVDPAFALLEEFTNNYLQFIIIVVVGAAVLRK